MALEVWPLGVFVVFVLLRLRRRRAARRRALMVEDMAARARLLRFITAQSQQRLFLYALLSRRLSTACLQRRTVWARQRNRSYLPRAVTNWSDTEWKQNFRVSRATFRFLCRELRPFLQRREVVRAPLSVEQRVALCLTRLGSNSELRIISNLFGVGLSTTCIVLHEVCRAIVDHLAAKYIHFPTGQGLRTIVDGFESKWGFPQCTGAIDGSHIPIIAPAENALDYYNQKGFHSVILQAVVDHEYKFLDVCVGWPGSVHDARVLGNSKIYAKCESGSFLPNWPKTICNSTVPLVMLGDPAYPLKTWLMKPFSDTGLTQRQWKFNYRLSRARVVVECAFGRLKGRWRSLMKRNDSKITNIPTLVTACCVLHNLCELHGDACEEDWVVRDTRGFSASTSATVAPAAATTSASRIRETLCEFFDN